MNTKEKQLKVFTLQIEDSIEELNIPKLKGMNLLNYSHREIKNKLITFVNYIPDWVDLSRPGIEILGGDIIINKDLYYNPIIQNNTNKSGKIDSVIEKGDIILCEWCNELYTFKIEDVRLTLNNPYIRPIDFVILIKVSYNNGISTITETIDNFKYIKHV